MHVSSVPKANPVTEKGVLKEVSGLAVAQMVDKSRPHHQRQSGSAPPPLDTRLMRPISHQSSPGTDSSRGHRRQQQQLLTIPSSTCCLLLPLSAQKAAFFLQSDDKK